LVVAVSVATAGPASPYPANIAYCGSPKYIPPLRV
ncbi:unnamed protein product, partial [marine sediment metagenome]